MKKNTLLPLSVALLYAASTWASSPKPAITLSASSLSFNGSSGQVSSQPLTITSASSSPMVIQALLFSNHIFSKQATLPVTLSKGQSVVVHVVAQPQSTAQTGYLTISTNQGLLTIPMTETATASTAPKHSVSLSWNEPASGDSDVAAYIVQRAASGSSQFSTLGTTGGTTFTDSSVQSSQTYTYEVLTKSDAGVTSAPSNKITLTIP